MCNGVELTRIFMSKSLCVSHILSTNWMKSENIRNNAKSVENP